MNQPNTHLNRRKFLKTAAQATVAVTASAGLGSLSAPLIVRAGEAGLRRGSRISYFFNGEIHVNEVGKPEGKPIWYAYPRWIEGESAIVYHSGETGKNQLYVYRLDDGSTRRVSTDPRADYRYPHGEAAPC